MSPRKDWKVVCPVHKTALTEETYMTSDGRVINITTCPHCKRVYSGDSAAISDKIVLEDGREVVWSNLRMVHTNSKKERKIKVVNATVFNLPINVVNKISVVLLGEYIIQAIDCFTINGNNIASVQGYFDVQKRKFYATLDMLTPNRIHTNHLETIDINDPLNLLSTENESKQFLNAWKAAKARNKNNSAKKVVLKQPKELHQHPEKLPSHYSQLYTVPLLRSGAEYKCPYCGQVLQDGVIIKCVVYRNFIPHHCVSVKVSYCKHCSLPISTQYEMEQIRKKTEPDLIKVVYANSFSTKEALLAVCHKKVKKLEPKQFPRIDEKALPYSKESWGKELPNLSTLSVSDSIFIYAKKCNCKKCQQRFGRDTISDRKATIQTKNGTSVNVNVQFCMGCGKYFMNLKSFYTYQKLYGDLKISLHFDANMPYYIDDIWTNFSRDSVLSRNGYNVKAGTSSEIRQRILCRILNEGFAAKHELISLLTQFIQLHQTTNPGACARWREDLLFVNQFEIDRQDDVGQKELLQGARINLSQKE